MWYLLMYNLLSSVDYGRIYWYNQSRSTYGATWQTVGDTIGIAFDADNGTVRFYKNGVDQGVAFSNIDTSLFSGCWRTKL